jgi:hypothetical protein
MDPLVTIDTNVFKDFLNTGEEGKNKDDHIDRLLVGLAKRHYRLCVDDQNRIDNEYKNQIGPTIAKLNETDMARYVLDYWLNKAQRETVPLDMQDALMKRIAGVIIEHKESLDRILIYVAIKSNTILITNDEAHIVSRRKGLRKIAKREGSKNFDVLSSAEAAGVYLSWSQSNEE